MILLKKILSCFDELSMLTDGGTEYVKKPGLENDMTARGMEVRSQRFSMLVEDGLVKALNVEQPGKFDVSDAGTMLKNLGG